MNNAPKMKIKMSVEKQASLSVPMALALASLGLAALVVIPAIAQTPKPAAPATGLQSAEVQSIKAAIAKPAAVRLNAVMMQFTGTFDDLPAKFEAFAKEFEAQGLTKQKLPSAPVGIYAVYEDPSGKTSYRLAVGLQVPIKLEAKDPLKAEAFSAPSAVRVTHAGPYKSLSTVHETVMEMTRAATATTAKTALTGRNASYPVIARLLNDPRKVPENQRRTELIVPFEKAAGK